MADTREIKVTIVEKGANGSSGDKKKKGATNKVQEKNNNLFDSVILNKAVDFAIEDVNKIATYEVNKFLNLHDDYVSERNITVAMSVIDRAKRFGVSVYAGAVVGGPIGAAVAVIGQMATMGIDIYQNYDKERVKIAQMNAQLGYQRQRAGFSLTSGSIGENK